MENFGYGIEIVTIHPLMIAISELLEFHIVMESQLPYNNRGTDQHGAIIRSNSEINPVSCIGRLGPRTKKYESLTGVFS